MIFCQELSNIYGDFSADAIINRWKNFPFDENDFVEPSDNFHESEENTADIIREIESEQKDIQDSTQNFEFPPITRPSQITNDFPPIPQKNKFSPVSIADSKDWAKLRAEVLDLHELKNFFVGKSDSQSPQFINLIENYKKSVEKNLARSEQTDEDSSNDFVERLAEVIGKRFYTILKSCERGRLGKGAMPKDYYLEIEERIKKYFERIGLQSENIKRMDNFRQWQDHMKVIDEIPAQQIFQDKKICDVEIQPHYFEYYGDDGEIEKFYIDGECTVYKFSD